MERLFRLVELIANEAETEQYFRLIITVPNGFIDTQGLLQKWESLFSAVQIVENAAYVAQIIREQAFVAVRPISFRSTTKSLQGGLILLQIGLGQTNIVEGKSGSIVISQRLLER